jgi:hypothetical protein
MLFIKSTRGAVDCRYDLFAGFLESHRFSSINSLEG